LRGDWRCSRWSIAKLWNFPGEAVGTSVSKVDEPLILQLLGVSNADEELPKMFKKRAPLSRSAKRAGWQGFPYNLGILDKRAVVRLP
jgi:hypothetical protein